MCHPLQDSLLCLSAAAGRGEVDKDSRHEAAVRAAFIPLVVETLGLWSPSIRSLAVLRSV